MTTLFIHEPGIYKKGLISLLKYTEAKTSGKPFEAQLGKNHFTRAIFSFILKMGFSRVDHVFTTGPKICGSLGIPDCSK